MPDDEKLRAGDSAFYETKNGRTTRVGTGRRGELAASMRDRCREFLNRVRGPADVDALVEFVCAEVGRGADPKLDKALPLVLYFADDQDRDEFIAATISAFPGWKARKV